MIYVVLLMFLAGLTLGVGGMNSWTQSALERKEAKRIQVEARLAEETAKAVREAENKLVDMQAAFEAGQQQAKVIYKTVYAKAQSYVQSNPAYSNPVCTVDLAGVQHINSAIATLQRTAAAAALGIQLPSAGTSEGEGTTGGGSVPAVSGGAGDVPGLHSEATKLETANPVPGASVQRPSKPKPIN